MKKDLTKTEALRLAIDRLYSNITIIKIDNPQYTPNSDFSNYYNKVLSRLEELYIQVIELEKNEIAAKIEFSD